VAISFIGGGNRSNLPEVMWYPTGFPYNMMFMLFNSNTMGATSGAGAANASGAP